MPSSTAALSASTIKRAAKLMAAALKSTMPPPIIQNLISNPALLRALVDELSLFVGGEAMKVTAGRKQIVFLGNTGPNNGREWVVIQYRNLPNGNGENVMRVSQRLGREPTLDQPVQWTDPSLMGTFLTNMRTKLSRPGVMLMNKLKAVAATEVRAAVDPKTVKWLKVREADWKTGGGYRIIPLDKQQRAIPPEQFTDKRVQKVLNKLYPYFDEAQDAGQSVFRNAMVSASTEVRAVDQAMVTELKLFIENDGQLYRQRTRPVQENLEKKWKKGKYDHAQAPKLWLYLVNDGMKKYIKEQGSPGMKIDVPTRKQVAQELADEWQMEMEAQLGPMGGASASTEVKAGSWQEQAKAELEAELGGIETEEGRDSGRDYFTLETSEGRADNGESEWMVFKDSKAAERYAIEYVNDMLEDDASMFDQKWLKQHVTVSPTDIRIISQEDADAYVDNIRYESDERVLDEAGMLRAWESLDDKKDQLSDKMLEEMDPRKQAQMQKQIEKMEQAQTKLVDKADQKLRASMAKDTADALKKDPLGWAEELGFDIETNRPPWLQIDTRKAAADAVQTDGVAHFLDSYDGDEVDLKSGAVAFGTN